MIINHFSDKGFSLIEVIVALLILSTSLLVIYQSAIQSSQSTYHADAKLTAAMYANNLLSQFSQATVLQEGTQTYQYPESYIAQVTIKKIPLPTELIAHPHWPHIYRIVVKVTWGTNKFLAFETLKRATP